MLTELVWVYRRMNEGLLSIVDLRWARLLLCNISWAWAWACPEAACSVFAFRTPGVQESEASDSRVWKMEEVWVGADSKVYGSKYGGFYGQPYTRIWWLFLELRIRRTKEGHRCSGVMDVSIRAFIRDWLKRHTPFFNESPSR